MAPNILCEPGYSELTIEADALERNRGVRRETKRLRLQRRKRAVKLSLIQVILGMAEAHI